MSDCLSEFTFCVKNLGSVHKGSFTHKPLTIFCGPNNSGKTWTLYCLYFFYKELRSLIQNDEEPTLLGFNEHVTDRIPFLFNIESSQLNTAEFSLIDSQIQLQRTGSIDVFLLPAERSGLQLVFRELSNRRTALLHHASRDNIDLGELLWNVVNSPYAMPIADYITWLNIITAFQQPKKGEFHFYAEHLKRGMVRGSYSVDPGTGSIDFRPYRFRGDRRPTVPMGLHMTSSSVKSLFGLWFYLEHHAETGDVLMIDEPELNIHPENQRRLARFLARLVNSGLKVVISTHSDYIVRELNSLIMLSQDKYGKLRKRHKYEDHEILQPEKVGAYLFDKQTIMPFQITPDDGIYATTFDEVIRDLNFVNDDIFYSLQEQKMTKTVIHNLARTIAGRYRLRQKGSYWLLDDGRSLVRIRMQKDHSFGFRLDNSRFPPLGFLSENPPKHIAKMCDAIIAQLDGDTLYYFVIEQKTSHEGDYDKQLANGKFFCQWLVSLFDYHNYWDAGKVEYIGLLVWQPRQSPPEKRHIPSTITA